MRAIPVRLAARTEEGLASLVSEIEQRGGRGIHVVCDVAIAAEVERVTEAAPRG